MLMDRADSHFLTDALTSVSGEAVSPIADEVTGLFDSWRDRLLAYIVTLGLTMHDGEEVVQEVFLSLFTHLSRGKSRENLRGWIFRVGHNIALKRRSAVGRQRLEQFEQESVWEVRDSTPNPEQALAIKQTQLRLLAVVRALPEQDRCCLHLRAEGLRYREIAEVLGISLGGVAMSLERSLQRLERVSR